MTGGIVVYRKTGRNFAAGMRVVLLMFLMRKTIRKWFM
jgi:hypothetical protein